MASANIHKIEVLCPPKKCKKCQRIIKALEDFIQQENIAAEIVIISDMEQIITKNTWILPTILIDGNVVSRGYFPDKKTLNKILS